MLVDGKLTFIVAGSQREGGGNHTQVTFYVTNDITGCYESRTQCMSRSQGHECLCACIVFDR